MRRYSIAALIFLIATGLILSGCLTPDDPDPMGEAEDPMPVESMHPRVIEHTSSINIALATPLISINNGPEDSYSLELPRSDNLTGYVLELSWDAESPNSESLDLWVRALGAGAIPPEDPTDPIPEAPIVTAKGTSPLRIELPVEDIPDDRAYEVLVRAHSEPAGVALDQPFELYIAVFEDMAFEADYAFSQS